MKKERPQEGNPHKLTWKQHVFPAASIKRFSDVEGNIEVKRVGARRSFAVKSDNKIFCAEFVWDHGSESGFMKRIEDQYQALINNVLNNKIFQFSDTQNQMITKMYILCYLRFKRNKAPIPSQKLNGVDPENLTLDEREILEKKGCLYLDSNSMISSRMLTGENIKHELNHVLSRLVGFNWGVLVAEAGEFIVPDNFIKYRYLSLTPTMILAANQVSRSIGIPEVEKINRDAVKSSDSYFFARELSVCPLLKPLSVFVHNEL